MMKKSKWKIRDKTLFYDGMLVIIDEQNKEVGKVNPQIADYIVDLHNKTLDNKKPVVRKKGD